MLPSSAFFRWRGRSLFLSEKNDMTLHLIPSTSPRDSGSPFPLLLQWWFALTPSAGGSHSTLFGREFTLPPPFGGSSFPFPPAVALLGLWRRPPLPVCCRLVSRIPFAGGSPPLLALDAFRPSLPSLRWWFNPFGRRCCN